MGAQNENTYKAAFLETVFEMKSLYLVISFYLQTAF